MEFGKLEDISGVDWRLPEDAFASKFKREPGRLTVLLGSPAWGNRSWLGKIYPEKTPTEKFLHFYSQNFECIELNASHYKIPDEETTRNWVSEVARDFVFCPKVNKEISHGKFGLTDKRLLDFWTRFLENLGDHCGPSFIQFHELFAYENRQILFRFLESWPSEFKLSIELRHPSWFKENKILPALVEYLSRKGMGLVITDVAGRRDVLHSSQTVPWQMIRLIGNNLDPSDTQRVQSWIRRFKTWEKAGIDKVYLFIHQPDDILTVEYARIVAQELKSHGYETKSAFELPQERDLFSF